MPIEEIVAAVDAEIARLHQVRTLLAQNGRGLAHAGSLVDGGSKPRRKMSAAGRARIAAAQRARWAKLKKAAK